MTDRHAGIEKALDELLPSDTLHIELDDDVAAELAPAPLMFEFDYCTKHLRATLRCEDLETTRSQLLTWGADASRVSAALALPRNTQVKLPLADGFYSVVRRVA